MSPEQHARFARQLMLPEIGEAGQRRILAGVARVDGDTLAHAVATRYAERAGFATVVAGDIETGDAREIVGHAAPRDVLHGSRAALAAIRITL